MPANNFFQDRLYPLQDEVLGKLSGIEGFDFYLTGGTALNRCFHHLRFSDDLDLFSVRDEPAFREMIKNVVSRIRSADRDVKVETLSDHFCRLYVITAGTSLKIDLVNDVVAHWGGFERAPLFHRVDNRTNILANKITALSRHEAKDMVDIWSIANAMAFSWRDIMEIAMTKSPVDPLDVAQMITAMPKDELKIIKWSTDQDIDRVFTDLQRIAADIVAGKDNSICIKK